MKLNIIFLAIALLIAIGCNQHTHDTQEADGLHLGKESHAHDVAPHDEEEALPNSQYTAYSSEFELFAEAEAFVAGHTSNVLAHLSILPDFKALEEGRVKIRLILDGMVHEQILEQPTRKGIYSFDIKPEIGGEGVLEFEISTEKGDFSLSIPQVIVYQDEQEARSKPETVTYSMTNAVVFTKEQSWMIDFATAFAARDVFGPIIKTTAQIQSAPGDEIILSAETSGILNLTADDVLEGKSVSNGQVLFHISGSGLADNNSAVRFAESKNNFKKAQADYQRSAELARDKIISEKDLSAALNRYENAKIDFENLQRNFNANGQIISCPKDGYVKHLFVENGQFVQTGDPVVTIAQNKSLLIHADVQQKYASILTDVYSANIRTIHDNKTYTLEQLNGKMVSFGRSTSSHNYQIPVNFRIDNLEQFISGGFVELFMKTKTNSEALVIPNTALIEEQGYYFVYIQKNPELFEKREVKVGVTDGLRTEITAGLSTDERIVSKGAIFIKLGQSTGTLDAHSGHVH